MKKENEVYRKLEIQFSIVERAGTTRMCMQNLYNMVDEIEYVCEKSYTSVSRITKRKVFPFILFLFHTRFSQCLIDLFPTLLPSME